MNRHGRLVDESQVLTTLPGDEYELVYNLPPNFASYELFLDSQGYYLEWMRTEWLVEENPRLLAKMFRKPKEMLRYLAPEFKQVESQMETAFWNSRYVKP